MTNKEVPKLGSEAVISQSFAEKIFPRLDLENPRATQEKLRELLKGLEGCKEYYDELAGDETAKDEELEQAYAAYVQAIEKILPAGFFLEEVNQPRESTLWRGTDPFLIFSLLTATENSLNIVADAPNIAHRWETSLSYGHGRKVVKLPLAVALGFKRPEGLEIKGRETSDLYQDVIEIGSGKIGFDDARELALRLKGKAPGKVFPPKFYKIAKKEALAA